MHNLQLDFNLLHLNFEFGAITKIATKTLASFLGTNISKENEEDVESPPK